MRRGAWVWGLAAVALAVGIWFWVERDQVAQPPGIARTEPSASEPSTEAVENPVEARRLTELESELLRANQELELQRQAVAELEAALEAARSDAERNRRGLERAVEELNRLGEELDRLRREAARRAVRSDRPVPTAGVRVLGAPLVTISPMGFVVASGEVYNPLDHSARGTLEVSLVGSAGVIETRDFLMHIPPGSTERYDITFTNVFPTERIAARASWRQ